jgi:hypothetical protein
VHSDGGQPNMAQRGAPRRHPPEGFMSTLVALALTLGLAAAPLDLESAKKAGTVAADAFLVVVDQGKFDEAWSQASPTFRSGVTREDWTKKVSGARTPLGAAGTRKVQSARFAETLAGAPDGNYVVVTYGTEFEKKKDANETVVAELDADGSWKIAGYWIR